MHCHLLAGLDDGPRTQEDAVAMCRISCEEGVHMAAATAHQNKRWNEVTPQKIREATEELKASLRKASLPLTVFPCSEVMVEPETPQHWNQGKLLSIADHNQFMLLEMPRGMFVDLHPTVERLQQKNIRLLLAHPEQYEEFMEKEELLKDLIRAGCLVQVSTGNLTKSLSRKEEKTLKGWFQRGLVHVMGSDGHSPRKRQPRMADAYHQVVHWVGTNIADRVFSINGMALLQGLPLNVPMPKPRTNLWFLPFATSLAR